MSVKRTKVSVKKREALKLALICTILIVVFCLWRGGGAAIYEKNAVRMAFGLPVLGLHWEMEKIWDSYSGVPCEGNAVYRATCDYDTEMTEDMLKHWDSLPVKDSVLRLCSELKEVDMTEIQAGRWKMVKHGQGNLDFYLGIYDETSRVFYFYKQTG